MKKKSPEKSRRATTEDLKTKKSSLVQKYKKFHLIQQEYASNENIAKALDTDIKTFNLVANNPKYKPLLGKIKTLTTNGLAALMRTIGTEIKKDANLVSLSRLRKKLDNLKTELSETLEKWYTTHANLDRALEGEKKRLELQHTLSEKVEVDSAKDLDINIVDKHKHVVKLIRKTSEFKQMEEKINTVSLDKVIYFVKDETFFTPLEEKINDIVKAENKRQEYLTYLKDGYAEDEAMKIRVTQNVDTSDQLEQTKLAIKNSYIYKDLIDKLHLANTDEILEIDDVRFFKHYGEKLAIIGYQHVSKTEIEKALMPYLALKPKGISDEKYLEALKKSSFYKKAIATANSENLSVQKKFNPSRYFDYNAEVGVKSKNTLYNYAVMTADGIPTSSGTGKVASNHQDENSA